MQHVFLEDYQAVVCYSPRDRGLMQRLSADLKQAGVRVWTGDHLKFESDYWLSSIEQALAQAKGLLVLMTPEAAHSPEVRLTIQLAKRQQLAIYPILMRGSDETSIPDGLRDHALIDLRNQVAFQHHLAVEEITAPLLNLPKTEGFTLKFWNPLHQWLLLMWMCWSPRRVVDYQEAHGAEPVRQTAKWLALWLVLLVQVIWFIEDEFQQLRLGSMGRVFFWLFWGCFIALLTQQEPQFWANYRESAKLGVGLLFVVLPGVLALLLDGYPNLPSLRPGRFASVICMVLLSAIALGIAETFQVRSNLVVVLVAANPLFVSAAAARLVAPPIMDGIGLHIGSIGVLSLFGIAVGMITILVLYGLTFLLANDLMKALYTRRAASHWGRAVPVVVGLSYIVLVISGVF